MPLPVLMIVASEDDGGMARVAYLLASHLGRFDIDVHVAVHRVSPLTAWLGGAGIGFTVVPELIETPTRPRDGQAPRAGTTVRNLAGLARAVARVRQLASDHNARVLYSHNTWSHYVAAAAGSRWRAPGINAAVVWHIHNDHSRTLTAWADRIVARFGRVAAIAAVSRSVAAPFERLAVPLTVVTNGIDIHACDRAREAPRLRAALNLDSRAIVVAYTGRLVAHKGIFVLLEAASRAVQADGHVHVVVLGGNPRHEPGDLVARLRASVASSQAAGRIHLLGYVSDVPPYVADADVAVVPSICADGFPLAAIEALSLGIPVVASRIGGLPELVRDGEDGLLVPPGDASALANAIVILARNPALRERMSRAARAASASRFDVRTMAASVARVLREAAGRAPHSR